MANVYSTRFIVTAGGPDAVYTVPAGFRAVIRCVTAINLNPAPSGWSLRIAAAGIYVMGEVLPAAGTTGRMVYYSVADARLVVDEGEPIRVSAVAGCGVTVSGYLLAE